MGSFILSKVLQHPEGFHKKRMYCLYQMLNQFKRVRLSTYVILVANILLAAKIKVRTSNKCRTDDLPALVPTYMEMAHVPFPPMPSTSHYEWERTCLSFFLFAQRANTCTLYAKISVLSTHCYTLSKYYFLRIFAITVFFPNFFCQIKFEPTIT